MLNGQWFTSSADATKISATITGILAALSGFIIYAAATKGLTVSPAQITDFGAQCTALISAIWTASSLAYSLFGVLRKVFIKVVSVI